MIKVRTLGPQKGTSPLDYRGALKISISYPLILTELQLCFFTKPVAVELTKLHLLKVSINNFCITPFFTKLHDATYGQLYRDYP